MGVAEWFRDFCGNIQVKNSATISTRYRAITKRLNADFWNTNSESAHSLYVGSYGRNTAINGTSDVDMVFLLPTSLYSRYDVYIGNGQSALLQAVRTSIAKTYSSSSIGADGQVVQIVFNDGVTFEVVPAFDRSGGPLTYPDSSSGGKWRQTHPRAEIEGHSSTKR